jgi:hypothetical protein
MLVDETLEGDHRAWSYAGDGALITNVSRAHIQAGVPNHIVVNDGAGMLSSVAVLEPARGGLGSSSVPIDGQIPIGNGGVYTASQLTTDGTIIITPGPGSIQLSAVGGGGGGTTRMVISELSWMVNATDPTAIAYMPWRAVNWAATAVRIVSYWHEPSRGFTIEAKNHLGVILGTSTVTFGEAAGLKTFTLSPQATDTVLTFWVTCDNMRSYVATIKGLYLDAL